MELRPASSQDLEVLVAVHEAGAVAALGHIFPQDEHPFPREVVRRRWAAELADPDVAVSVCTDEAGSITGFAALHGDELLHFGTAPRTWGSGLAARLHDALLSSVPPSVTRCRLRVFAEIRRARRFSEKLGWICTGEVTRSPFPPHPELVTCTRARSPAVEVG